MADLRKTDPEFFEIFNNFTNNEVRCEQGFTLDEETRYIAVLAALIGCGGTDAFEEILPEALEAGVSPVKVKETVYQAQDYLGYGRMLPFLNCTNKIFNQLDIKLPLPSQSTTTPETRLKKGVEAQSEIFGEQMQEAWKKSHINQFLASNCFGDFYTRKGLTYAEREMITFCFLAAQGGCEPQLTAHAKGNMNIGNDRAFLMSVITQCLPYIGYPRTLNAIACLK